MHKHFPVLWSTWYVLLALSHVKILGHGSEGQEACLSHISDLQAKKIALGLTATNHPLQKPSKEIPSLTLCEELCSFPKDRDTGLPPPDSQHFADKAWTVQST